MSIGFINIALSIYLIGLVAWLSAVVAGCLPSAKRRRWRVLRSRVSKQIAPLATAFGVLIAGWTFSLQARQTAEIALHATGEVMVGLEFQNPHIACLYEWHGWSDPNACLLEITSDPHKYRQSMLYIEEALFLIENARKHRRLFGADYAEDIKYWANDITDDPTGMFSYQAVVENPANPAGSLRGLGIRIDVTTLCENYRRVRGALARNGADPPEPAGRFALDCLHDVARGG